MARRRRAEKRKVAPDTKYQNKLVGRFITQVMSRGKKSVAERLIYGAFGEIHEQTQQEPLEVFEKAIGNVKPHLEVKSRRVGGATYQVPVEISRDRQVTLALRWIIQYAKARKGMSMRRALALELVDALKNQGASVKKRDDTHKMAQANKAFAHYRW
ncbi:MAG: 30S ribosomal protein S7 [Kiritimatiellae bacterium]|nr:30S ribosomal protein S7 [Kiritimatiellia bacterium]